MIPNSILNKILSPSPLNHVLVFLRSFADFLQPLLIVFFAALLVAGLFLRLYRFIYGRFATSEELFDEAISLLKRDGLNPNNSASRNLALDNLRLVIHLNPDLLKAYIVLSQELLYGAINKASLADQRRQYKSRKSLRHRLGLIEHLDNTSTPELIECRNTIGKGLIIDPTNDSLLKLQAELNLVMKYGMNNIQTKMMNVGVFGSAGSNF